MKSWLSWLIARRWLILAGHLVVLALAALGLPRLSIDNSPQAFFVDDARELELYQRYRTLFGRDQTLRFVITGDELWTAEGLAFVAELEQQAAETFGVVGTAGLYGHHRWRWPDWPPIQPEVLREQATQDPLDLAAGWTDPEGSVITIMALLYDLSPTQVRTLSHDLDLLVERSLAEAPSENGIDVTIVGLPVVAQALDQVVLDVAERTFPILVGFSVLLLIVITGSPRTVAVVLAQVGFVMTLLFGAVGWQGAPLDMVQSILAPIVFVVTLANALYLWVELAYRRRAGATSDALSSLVATYQERGWAVVWAGATTIVGFGSLALSELPPIRHLGLWTAFGLAVATIEAFVLYPLLLSFLPLSTEKRAGAEQRLRPLGRAVALRALAHRGSVLLGFTVLALIAATGVLRLEIGTGLLDYFEPEAPVRADLEAVQALGVGVVAADLILETGLLDGGAFGQPAALAEIAALTARLREQPGVAGVLSAAELVDAGRRLDDPSGRLMVRDACAAQVLLASIPQTAPMLRSAITPDGSATRVSLFLPFETLEQLQPVFERARAEAEERFPDSRVWLTGLYPLVLEGQRSLLATMILSLSVTFLFVALGFGFLVRRLRPLVAMLLPNLWPVLFVLGFMGWSGIRLDSTTLMIAAVVLSLSVDDTLHTLGAFRRRGPVMGAREGAIAALEHTLPGHLLTTLVLASGFALCGLSSFVPVARFGELAALGMVVALLADLLLVPVLLAGLSERDLAALRSRSTVDVSAG